MTEFTINDLKPFLDPSHRIVGKNQNPSFTSVKPITEADAQSLVWVNPTKKEKQKWAEETQAEIIICDDSLELTPALLAQKCFVVVPNPKLTFLRAVSGLFGNATPYGRHETAFVHAEANVHPQTYLGPFTYVGKCTIGEGTILHGNVHLYDKVTIGKNVVIHAGTVVGADGFGYARDDEGKLAKFPHVGGVVIEDDVEIGSNTSIDRGTLGNTLIKTGAKIDNQVHISHNVTVGRHTAVIANSMIGGSAQLGDYAWIAPSVSVKNGITIGDKALIGMGAVVLKDVPAEEIWIGSPARRLEKKT